MYIDCDFILQSGVENGGLREDLVRVPVRVQKKKPENFLMKEKRVGKKKISAQDQVALKVVSFIT